MADQLQTQTGAAQATGGTSNGSRQFFLPDNVIARLARRPHAAGDPRKLAEANVTIHEMRCKIFDAFNKLLYDEKYSVLASSEGVSPVIIARELGCKKGRIKRLADEAFIKIAEHIENPNEPVCSLAPMSKNQSLFVDYLATKLLSQESKLGLRADTYDMLNILVKYSKV